jgi:hypothetical protein
MVCGADWVVCVFFGATQDHLWGALDISFHKIFHKLPSLMSQILKIAIFATSIEYVTF